MALDDDGRIGEVVEDGLKGRGIPGESVAGVATNVGLVVVEVGILDVRPEAPFDGDRGRRRGWRRGRWRRCGHVDSGRRRGGSTRTGGRQCIGGGIAWADTVVARALDGS